jgi:hypothetical protein
VVHYLNCGEKRISYIFEFNITSSFIPFYSLLLTVVLLSTMAVSIFKFGTSSPADTTPFKELKKAGYDSKDILAVVGKTEGE